MNEEMKTKSVEELRFFMDSAFNDLAVKVAFKEGYNCAVKIANPLIIQAKEESVKGFKDWLEKHDGGYGDSPDYQYQMEQYIKILSPNKSDGGER